jgi:hypothetical protein
VPYEGEFASYRSLNRIAQTERVKHLLTKATKKFNMAIDGNYAEVPGKNGYQGAQVGYVTVASVLLNLHALAELDEQRPIDPAEFRKTEEAATVDAALPGSNVVTREHLSAKTAFREALFEVFHDAVVDADDPSTLLDTFSVHSAKMSAQ